MNFNPFRRALPAPAPTAPRRSLWQRLTGAREPDKRRTHITDHATDYMMAQLPYAAQTMDGMQGGLTNGPTLTQLRGDGDMTAANPEVWGFFAGQSLPLPYFMLAQLSAHWMIDKACRMPARDAVRQGYQLAVAFPDPTGDSEEEKLEQKILRADRKMGVDKQLQEFVHMGRVFGLRILMFRVDSPSKDYYEFPFNPDGVAPGSYKGIVQVDPQWCVPELAAIDMLDPTSPHFYEPEFWYIGQRKVHRSHLVIFRNGTLPDFLKPMYRYGSVSVPQRIVERVYNAERVANEAPELTMTKRTTAVTMDLGEAEMSWDRVRANLAEWVATRNNYGVKVMDSADTMQQFDTSLADLDNVIMTGYQLVAAAANVPATKLLGTTPKGFNATGEAEEANYHEELESIQTHDLTPVLDRHYLLLMRSWGLIGVAVEHTWLPLDSPTAKEYADTELVKAQRDAALQLTGAIDSADIRRRLASERDGDFYGLDLDNDDTEGEE